MTDNKFQHFPSGNSNSNTNTIMQSSAPYRKPILPKYVFEFGSDEKIYSVSFEGRLSREDIRMMLESLHQELYADCGSAIHSYLEQNNIHYSQLKMEIFPLSHQEIMNRAKWLLQSCCQGAFNSRISRTDNYYAVMDQQIRTPDGGCEGCYYAVQKSADGGNCHYRIIGQTFTCNKSDETVHGYFAVRAGESSRKIHNLDTISGELVLPAFGCIDIMGILINIDDIGTSGNAKKFALN